MLFRSWVSASPSSGDERQPDSWAVPVMAVGSQPVAALASGLALVAGGAALVAGVAAAVVGPGLASPLLHAAAMRLATAARTKKRRIGTSSIDSAVVDRTLV